MIIVKFKWETLIPEHHVARVVNEVVEAIPDTTLFSHYKGGGRSFFHPENDIEKETDIQNRKEKRQEHSKWKKSLKLIRENFLPRVAKCKEQKEIFGSRNSYS